jgi:hypothetical protein
MELQITKEAFKSQAKKQHAALKARNVELKLSDIQESLAIAYGFENLATLYAAFREDDYSEVDDVKPLLAQTANLFVLSWRFPENDDGLADEVMYVFPPGTTLNMVGSYDYEAVHALREKGIEIPEGLVFSKETVALENFSMVPRIDKYGLHELADERAVNKYIKTYMGFRVPRDGVEVNLYDMGDDGGSKDHLLVWLNDEDSAKVRALFGQ